MDNRRIVRSDLPSEALALLLEAQRVQLGVRTLVVTTPTGDLVASAGPDPTDVAASILEELEGGPVPELATWQLRVGDRDLIIGSLGGRLDIELGDGVRRICAA